MTKKTASPSPLNDVKDPSRRGDLQGQQGETGKQVERQQDKLQQVIGGVPGRSGVVLDGHLADAPSVPRQQPVDECEVEVVVEDAFDELAANNPVRGNAYMRSEGDL